MPLPFAPKSPVTVPCSREKQIFSRTDYRDLLQVAVRLLYISRYMDRKEFETAHALFSEMEPYKGKIIGLYAREIECELLFLELIGKRRKEEVERLYTDGVKKHIQLYKAVMSSKPRLLCALALHWEHQPERAKEIYEEVSGKQDKYLMQGEVFSDLDIMETMLREAEACRTDVSPSDDEAKETNKR